MFHTAHIAWLFQVGSGRPESKFNYKFCDADAADADADVDAADADDDAHGSKLTNYLLLRETVRCASCGYHRSDVQAQRPEILSLVITFPSDVHFLIIFLSENISHFYLITTYCCILCCIDVNTSLYAGTIQDNCALHLLICQESNKKHLFCLK